MTWVMAQALMPVLPEAETTAGGLLLARGISAPPVDPESLAKLWPGLKISYEDLDGAGYFLDMGREGGEILVRRADVPVRKRYTLAHELGHWVIRNERGSAPETEVEA